MKRSEKIAKVLMLTTTAAFWIAFTLLAKAVETSGNLTEITGTLEVVQVCYADPGKNKRWYDLIDDQTGKRHRLHFDIKPGVEHLTGERVRVRGHADKNFFRVRPSSSLEDNGLEVLAAAKPSTNGTVTTASPKILYGGGTNVSTVVHKTLVELLNYSDYATNHYTAASIVTFSNKFFATTGSSINTAYLEDSFGAVGFAGDVVICNIASTSANDSTSTWMSQGDAAATAQGYTPGNYAHKVYITSGAGGWAGLAAVGGSWSMDFYTDGGTICHELGHNLGFNHASSQWNNTSAWDEYGDSSDFMGASYDWRHNNGPHKVQRGWIAAQTITRGGIYQISRIEDMPSSVPNPQVLKLNSSTPPNGWPYYFSYKQPLGFDVNNGRNTGVSVHRYNNAGGNTALVAYLADGGSFTDTASGMTVKQISHDTNQVTVVIATCNSFAQPWTLVMTSEQLSAKTPMIADVTGDSNGNPLTITAFDAASIRGGTVTLTNNELLYTPPGLFTGNDSFEYTVTNILGVQSSSYVTVFAVTQPHYVWDANGATAGTGGSGIWNTSSFNWDDGTHIWPSTGSSNFALFQGAAGTVTLAAGGVAANGLYFGTDGYVVQNNTLTLTGAVPVMIVDGGKTARIASVLAGSSGCTKLGTGTIELTANNSLAGNLVVNEGVLSLAQTGTNNFGTTNSVIGSAVLTINRGATVEKSAHFQISAINNSNNTSQVVVNGGLFDCGAFQEYLRTIDLTGGVVRGMGAADHIIIRAPANLTVNSFASTNSSVMDGLGVGQVDLTFGNLLLNVADGEAVTDLLFAAEISENTGAGSGAKQVVKSGPGTLLLSANNTYSGGTIVNEGKIIGGSPVSYDSTNAAPGFGVGPITVNAGATITGNAAFSVGGGGGNGGAANNRTINLNGGTLDVSYAGAGGDYLAALNLTGGTVSAHATPTAYFRTTAAGLSLVSLASSNSSTVSANMDMTYGNITANVAPGAVASGQDLVISGKITENSGAGTGAKSLIKSGLGTLVLTGQDSYTGDTVVSAGIVRLDSSAIASGTAQLASARITNSASVVFYRNARGFTPVPALSGGGDFYVDGPGGGSQWDYRINFHGQTSDNTGTIYLTNNGKLWVDMAGRNAIGDAAIVSVGPSAQFYVYQGVAETIGGLAGSGNVYGGDAAGSSALTVGGGERTAAFSGVLNNNGATLSLAKIGTGTQTLSGANTYTGPTVINNGLLLVNGSLAAGSAVTAAPNGTLGGSGTVNGTVTVNGTLAPGSGVGTLATGAETWNSGAGYICEINSTKAPGADRLNITGTLNVQAAPAKPFVVRLVSLGAGDVPGPVTNFNAYASGSWIIATATAGIQNFATNKFTVDTASFSNNWSGGMFSIITNGNSLVLNYTAAALVPPVFAGGGVFSGNSFPLTFSGPTGQTYKIVSSRDVSLPVSGWTVLSTGVFGGSPVEFTDVNATNVQQFYRIVSP